MPHWKLKGVLQGAMARTPGGTRLNDLLQRMAGGRRQLDAHIDSKFRDDWLVHIRHLRQLGFPLESCTMLEIGSGWLPVMPLCFHLAGVGRCLTYDLHRHLGLDAVRLALGHLERHLQAIAEATERPVDLVRGRYERLIRLDGAALLAAAGIEYHAPADATRTGLPAASVDLVFSNSVLEHVPPSVLQAMMQESARILTPGGLALHNVNCGDHYAYFDRTITQINYLRFSSAQWAAWNNDILYQNRLRAVDFLDAARACGLEIVLDTHKPRPALLQLIRDGFPVAPEFGRYPAQELACTSIDFAARKPA